MQTKAQMYMSIIRSRVKLPPKSVIAECTAAYWRKVGSVAEFTSMARLNPHVNVHVLVMGAPIDTWDNHPAISVKDKGEGYVLFAIARTKA